MSDLITSGQLVTVFTVGVKTVGGSMRDPGSGQIDGWEGGLVNKQQHFSKAISIKLLFRSVTAYELNPKAFVD